MKKLLAVLALGAFAVGVVGCSSDNAPAADTNLVVVKHKSASGTAKHKHHKKQANVNSAKMGS